MEHRQVHQVLRCKGWALRETLVKDGVRKVSETQKETLSDCTTCALGHWGSQVSQQPFMASFPSFLTLHADGPVPISCGTSGQVEMMVRALASEEA